MKNIQLLKKHSEAAVMFLFLLLQISQCCIVNKVSGDVSGNPACKKLSSGAELLVKNALADIPGNRYIDYHVHIVGSQPDVTGCTVNPRMQSWLHPVERIRYLIYIRAAGIRNEKQSDREYVSRLVGLIRSGRVGGRYLLLAMDRNYNRDGSVSSENTEFYVPNEYAFSIAGTYPEIFIPVVSINPYRPDALEELEKWGKRKVHFVKWLPNAMGFNPSDKTLGHFYKLMKKYNMVLLSHTGDEAAVDTPEGQSLGNPLLLRRPLDMGIRVIAAHCASLGQSEDIDNPGTGKKDNIDLFLRLMDEKKYEGMLFGDISGLIHFNRMEKPLQKILERQDLHPRLLQGSDYPLPAINIVIHTKKLAEHGYITEQEREHLNEIYKCNPLLFEYVVKRTIRHPKTGEKFLPMIFIRNEGVFSPPTPRRGA